jgi:hypothetical protein
LVCACAGWNTLMAIVLAVNIAASRRFIIGMPPMLVKRSDPNVQERMPLAACECSFTAMCPHLKLTLPALGRQRRTYGPAKISRLHSPPRLAIKVGSEIAAAPVVESFLRPSSSALGIIVPPLDPPRLVGMSSWDELPAGGPDLTVKRANASGFCVTAMTRA